MNKLCNDLTPTIEFVYFDLGNILLTFDPVKACRGLAALLATTPIEARKALYDSGLETRYEHGKVSSHGFAEELRRTFGRPESTHPDSAILESVSDIFTPIDSMRGILQSVRASGRRVGLLSNTCEAHWEWIGRQQYSVMDFSFDATILSFEVGTMKPERQIYLTAEEAAKTPVEQILFLDDRQENVDAAVAFGWNAKQCFGGDGAIGRLQEYQLIDLAR